MIILASSAVSPIGVAFALGTAVLWAVSAMCFASAGRRIGSFQVVLLRSFMASLALIALLSAYHLLQGSRIALPDRGPVLWLVLSGLAGLGIGDVLIFESMVLLGARRSSQIFSCLAPVASVLLAWMLLNENLKGQIVVGILLVLAATWYAVVGGSAASRGREPGRVSALGAVLAVLGAICVGAGAVAGRKAFLLVDGTDPNTATTVRVVSASMFLWAIPVASRRVGKTLVNLRDRHVLARMSLGVLAGPVGGMLCYMSALKYLQAGLVSTLGALSPLFMMPLVAWRYRTGIHWGVVLASAAAVAGVALICLA